MFRIGIDGRMIQGTGIATYTFELLKGALSSEKFREDFQFVLFTGRDQIEWVQKEFAFYLSNGRLEIVEANFHWYGFEEQIRFPLLIRKSRLDLMHFPHFNVSIWCPVPYVFTLHDLILLAHPSIRATRLSPWKFYLKKLGYLFGLKSALKNARAIFTFTQFGKNDILKFFPSTRGEKIHIIPEGPGHSDLPPKGAGDRNILLRYNIVKPYLLYVGNAYPHKNLETLIDGVKNLLSRGYDWQLVIVGPEDDFRKELRARAGVMGGKQVIFTGFIPKEDLGALYEFAMVYVYPSFYEGFALPILEAMYYGLPIVSSNRTVLPEILGDAVEYFDPSHTESMVNAILRVSSDLKRQAELREKGYRCREKYSWQSLTDETLKIYSDVLTHAKKYSKETSTTS